MSLNRYVSIAVASVIPLIGCANPYVDFYIDKSNGKYIYRPTSRNEVAPPKPRVITGETIESDSKSMRENGYGLIGYSSFRGCDDDVDQDDAVELGRGLRADAVILYSKYSHSVHETLQLALPTVSTSATSVHGTASSNGGSASIDGYSQTTTYGTQTTDIPYTINVYSYAATYWVKKNDYVFGATYRDLNTAERSAIQSNKGAVLTVIIKNSPAFNEDFLEGDIIRYVDSEPIIDAQDFTTKINGHAGKNVTIKFLRGMNEMERRVGLLPATVDSSVK